MVYLERTQRNGKTYFRLVHSFRKGDKTVHKRKYIGSTIPSKEKLKQLKNEFIKELQKEKYKYLSQTEIEEIELKRKEHEKSVLNLSRSEKDNFLKEFIIRFTYDSSKLSGVNVTLRQTYLILKEGVIPNDIKNIKTVKELENHQKGVLVITKYKGSLTLEFIKRLHKILLSGIEDSIAGKTRDSLKRNVKLAGTSYVPPHWDKVKSEIENFFKWYKHENRKLHPVELASLVHLKIISLQPFVDGNSRLSRLLMNWILWKKRYPPVEISIEDLERYYQALDMYQVEKNEKPFVDYIKEKYLRSKEK